MLGAKLLFQLGKVPLGLWRQRPFLHLAVRRRAQVSESARRDLPEGLLTRGELDFAGGGEPLHRLQERVQPAGAIDPVLCARPAAKLLPIVGQDGQAVTVGAELPQVRRRLFGWTERNQVAEPLVDGE